MPPARRLGRALVALAITAGCAGNDRREPSSQNQVEAPAAAPQGAPMTAEPTPTAAPLRFEQGTNNDLAGREVGIMNVYPDDDGSLVAQIAINDPATSKSDRSEVKRGDAITVGAKRFRVVEITPSKGNARGAVTLAPIEGDRP